MFQAVRIKSQRQPRSVVIETRDGRQVRGVLDLAPQTTAEMLLTSGSDYITLKTSDGAFAIHRDMIAALLIGDEHTDDAEDEEAEVRHALWSDESEGAFDPCRILQVRPGASRDELKEAWRARMRQCHPDSVKGQGFTDEIIDAAQREAQLVNRAYETLIGLRRPA